MKSNIKNYKRALFLFCFFLSWNTVLTSENKNSTVKAVREDAPCLGCGVIPCVAGGSSAVTDVIIQGSLSSIDRSLNFIKAYLLSGLVETYTITVDVSGLGSKMDALSVDFQETWTILDNIGTSPTLESKVDALAIDFQETWTALGSIEIDPSDFQETWTLIGDTAGTLDASITPTTIMDINATTTLSVIDWLKAIYDKVK